MSTRIDPSSPTHEHPDLFATTRWTVVVAAGERSTPQSERALEAICETYWFPIYAYIRRRGYARADAEDLTQEFFRRFLERHWIEDVDPEKGRLRAFLITAVKRFLAKEWRWGSAQKRGGGIRPFSMDADFGEERLVAAGTPTLPPDAAFDRQWALTLLDVAIRRLEGEFTEAGKGDLFQGLRDGLVFSHEGLDYLSMSETLGMSEGAVRVAVHRMRKRFRDLYREEVSHTLPAGVELEEEVRYLADSLARE